MLGMIFQFLATFACAIFSGAAIYVNLVEHPARLSCGFEIALKEWFASYKRAAIMQASLAFFGFFFAIAAWITSANLQWLIGGILFGLVIPYSLFVVMPINQRLVSEKLTENSEEAYRLLKKWGRLHAIRSLLSAIALVIFLVIPLQG